MTTPPSTPRCGAKTRNGGLCKLAAGAGTDHPGYGKCKRHSGSTPNGIKAAAKEEVQTLASRMAAAMGDGIESDPHEAILIAIRQASAEVNLFGSLAPGAERGPFVSTMFGPQLHAAIVERQKAMDRVVRYSKTALDAGVAQRQVQIAERLGAQLGTILQRVIGALDLTPQQMSRVPMLVRAELETLIDTGQIA